MKIDQKYCINNYWFDYPRKNKVIIDKTSLIDDEKKRLKRGETISKPDRGGSYHQYFIPIIYDDIL